MSVTYGKCCQGYARTKTRLESRLRSRQRTAAWILLCMTRAASSKPKSTSWSGRGMHHHSAIMENIFNNQFLWHHASLIFGPPVHSRFLFPPNFPCAGRGSRASGIFLSSSSFYERWQQTQIWLNGQNRVIKSRHLPTPGMMEPAEWARCRNITSQFRNWGCWWAYSWILWLWNNTPNVTQAYFNNDASACRDFYCVFSALNVWTFMPL